MTMSVQAPNRDFPSRNQAFTAVIASALCVTFTAARHGPHANDSHPVAVPAALAEEEPCCLTWSYKDILEAARRQQARA